VVVLPDNPETGRGRVVLLRCPPERDAELGDAWNGCHRCMDVRQKWLLHVDQTDIEDLRDL
jgi:hypothetical protein